MKERLQKFLSRAGVASRRKAEVLITEGRVTVNGQKAELGMKVSNEDEVRVGGERIENNTKRVTYAFNKPPGVITTVTDNRGRQTVIDLFPEIPGLHPAGRLDAESEGLLIVTNDGDLTLELTHPRYGHEKEYRVWCREGTLQAWALGKLEKGIELDDGLARAIVAKVADGGCTLVLDEGRNHQVRRMLGALGLHVTRLQRIRIGGLELGNLKPGGYRRLSQEDLTRLRGSR